MTPLSARKASTILVTVLALASSRPAGAAARGRAHSRRHAGGRDRNGAAAGRRGGPRRGTSRSSAMRAPRASPPRGPSTLPAWWSPRASSTPTRTPFGDLTSSRADRRHNAAYLMQGVTTVVTGNDGGGPLDVGAQLARMKALGIGTNVALYVGFGTIRSAVLGAGSGAPDAGAAGEDARDGRDGDGGGALGLRRASTTRRRATPPPRRSSRWRRKPARGAASTTRTCATRARTPSGCWGRCGRRCASGGRGDFRCTSPTSRRWAGRVGAERFGDRVIAPRRPRARW